MILTLENFEDEILNCFKPCVVTFKSSSCHLCKGLSQVVYRLKMRYGEHFKFGSVETFSEEEITDLFDIDGVPTVFLFINGDGREIPYPDNPSIWSGYSEEYLVEYLEEFLRDDKQG
tara:strand:- start:711 stop:1061 length:351 start_codon:yes stop_codon:yes gene_type:complete